MAPTPPRDAACTHGRGGWGTTIGAIVARILDGTCLCIHATDDSAGVLSALSRFL